ncbi:MAG: PAS domain-containing protein [Microbacterium sp.]|nr:PAS domain-containing protein [Microbacterium sp.]
MRRFTPVSVRRERPRRGLFADQTRARTAALNQLLLGSVVLFVTLLVIGQRSGTGLETYFLGVVMIFVLTGVTMVVPWNRIAPGWLAIIPVLDIVAILLLRLAIPDGGFGLLWVFPTMWLAAGFGVPGLCGGVLGACAAFLYSALAAHPEQHLNVYTLLLLPMVLLAVSATSYLTARRTAAQRTLLSKQAQMLSQLLERTRSQEQEVTEILDAVDFGVIRIGRDGGIAVTNEAHGHLQRAIAATDADTEAYRDDGVTPLPVEAQPIERALRGEAFDDQLVWFGPPEGERRALSVTARRLLDTHGEDAGAVVISRDVTAEATALRARDDLVASVTHELRTPLTSILGYLDLAIDDPDIPPQARGNLEIAERNAERLLGIVGDMLAASQASRGSAEFSVVPDDIDVAEVIRAPVESLLPRAAERAVLIDTSGLEVAYARADSMRLRQVIDNLISNAIKYNRDGGTVSLGSTADDGSVWILVRDTGLGITKEEQAGLFQRFYRGDTVRATGMKGTGLGLAISRDIVRAHGGDITVRSTPGVGSTFIVRLPAGSPNPSTKGERP